jgi:hypothetical protein
VLSDFNELTGNSDRNVWRIGRARVDISTMRLISPSAMPIISAENLAGRDIAFVADPFRIAVKNATYVFTEAWSRSTQRGQIAVFRLSARGDVVDSGIVLDEPFHLSYPCVFERGGDHYMLPEALESGQLLLYKARTFPWDWECFSVLLELDYADPQMFFHENVWYIFLNTDPLTNASASVFWAESPLGNWHPHPQNPIFSGDPLRARSAGPLIRHRRRIFRFSQDCRQRYGQCVFASEILELSPSSIRTTPIGQVKLDRPEWARSAFHHLDIFFEDGVHHALFDGYTGTLDPPPQQIQTEFPR